MMEYTAFVFIIPPLIYLLSFARYSWKKKEKLAAVGAVLLWILSMALPVVYMIIR